MSMVCPQCKKAYEKNLQCPTCNVRLQYHLAAVKAEDGSDEGDGWHHTPWGRIIVGLLLAQGLSYGIQHLFNAAFSATLQDGHQSAWATIWGLALLHGLQGLSLIIGAALAGAGQQRGTIYGSLIGLIHGLIFLVVQKQSGQLLTEVAVYAQPIVHMAFGTLGGRIGMLIWSPPPVLNFNGDSDSAPTLSWSAFSLHRYFAGPVHLARVVVGTIAVIIGVTWSNLILRFVLDSSGGALSLTTHLQDKLVLFEISALATLAGSGFAGATTFNGLKQGLCVGIGASIILCGFHLANPKMTLEATMFMIFSTVFLSLAGGWFGGQLFPPIMQKRRRLAADIW